MKLMLTCFLTLALSTVFAKDCEGYIIKNTGDTVKGVVHVLYKSMRINGEDQFVFGEMWTDFKFTSNGSKKTFKAGEIPGYGFKLDGKWYHFEVLDYEKNYGVKIPGMLKALSNDMRFFMHRIYDGAMPIYREYWLWEQVTKTEIRNVEFKRNITEWETWVRTSSGQFQEIAPSTGKAKKLKGFLEKLKLEAEFLKTLDDKLSFDDAEATLMKYNEWKKTH
jgi:hypothetical protein